jgi:hypothetical protein
MARPKPMLITPMKLSKPPRSRKAVLDRNVARHVARVKAGKPLIPIELPGKLSPSEHRYVQIETQKRLAKRGPKGMTGPVGLSKPAAHSGGVSGWLNNNFGAPAWEKLGHDIAGVPGAAATLGENIGHLGETLGKPLYNIGNAAIHGRLLNDKELADNSAATHAGWQLTGIPTLEHPIRSGPTADALALAGLFPFGKVGELGKLSETADATKAAEGASVVRSSRAAKKALVKGPKRTEEQALAHVAERNRYDAAATDAARAKGEMGGAVNVLKPGEITAETGGKTGQIIRHGLNPELGGGKYEKVGAKLDTPKLLRKDQEALRAPERSARAAAMERAAANATGVEKLYAATGVLKGELPKLEYRGLAKLTPELRDEAVNFIFDHPRMRIYEKRNSAQALNDALEGKVPTVGDQRLLERAFGKEVPNGLIAQAKKNGWANTINDVLGISRALRSSLDFSFPMRQGAVALAYNPKIWLKTYWPGMKLMGSEQGFQTAMKSIEAMPTHASAVKAGVAFTDIGESAAKGSTDIYAREEAMPSNYAERIPVIGRGVRASDRGYVGVGNLTRAHLFDYMMHSAAREGYHLTDDAVHSIAETVNSLTGRGNVKWLSGHTATLNALLFSPRLLMSRINFLNPLWYARLSPFARKEAMKAASRFFGAIGLTLLAIEQAGGKVGFDPRSADFGKARFGNSTRVDLGAGFNQLLHLYGQFATLQRKSTTSGKVTDLTAGGFGQSSLFDVGLQFLENKTNPIASTLITAAKGNQFGQPLDFSPNPLDTNSLVSNLWEPMSPQDAVSTYQQTHSALGGIGAGLLSGSGVGVQSYSALAANSPAKTQDATKKALTTLQQQEAVLNVPAKWRHIYGKGVRVQVQRDLAKSQARKVSKTGKITQAQSYKITMQTLLKAKMMTAAQYKAATRSISGMTDRELKHWEYEAWAQLGPGSLLEHLHHYYNVQTGK